MVGRKAHLRLLKRKVHSTEPSRVKVYECLAKDIVQYCAPGSKPSNDLIIKTFVMTKSKESSHRNLRGDVEAGALKWLAVRRCEHAPQLVCTFKMRNKKGRKKLVVVMQKIKGVTLPDRFSVLPPEKRQKIRNAFEIAVRAVADCGVFNGSAWPRNVIYNEQEDKW